MMTAIYVMGGFCCICLGSLLVFEIIHHTARRKMEKVFEQKMANLGKDIDSMFSKAKEDPTIQHLAKVFESMAK